MSPRTPLAKIAAAAVAGSLALGSGVALAALSDSPDPTRVTELDSDDATGQLAGALDDDSVDEAKVAVQDARDALKEAKEAAKEARPDAGGGTDDGDEGDDGDDQGGDDAGTRSHAPNHGQVVSAVAKATPPGPGHGKAVSAVARGTHGPSVDDDVDDAGQEVDREAEDDASPQDSGHGRGPRGRRN